MLDHQRLSSRDSLDEFMWLILPDRNGINANILALWLGNCKCSDESRRRGEQAPTAATTPPGGPTSRPRPHPSPRGLTRTNSVSQGLTRPVGLFRFCRSPIGAKNVRVRFARRDNNAMSGESMWCRLHDEPVDWHTFEWKGCWGCQHFSGLDSDQHVYVSEAAELLGVTAQTTRRWIKTGVLKGALYRRGRSQFSMSSPPAKYVIDRESVERVRHKRGRPCEASGVEQ